MCDAFHRCGMMQLQHRKMPCRFAQYPLRKLARVRRLRIGAQRGDKQRQRLIRAVLLQLGQRRLHPCLREFRFQSGHGRRTEQCVTGGGSGCTVHPAANVPNR